MKIGESVVLGTGKFPVSLAEELVGIKDRKYGELKKLQLPKKTLPGEESAEYELVIRRVS